MKKPRFPLLRSLRNFLSGKTGLRRAQVVPDDELAWHLLLSSFSARISIAVKMHTNNTHRVYFRHSFPGFASIELSVCHRKSDGTVKMLSTLHGSGYAFNALGDSRNVLIGEAGSNFSIMSLSVRYIAHGVSYHLRIDAEDGTQELLKEGRPYHHGPQYTLGLRSIPLTTFSPAPIFTTPRPGILPMSLAAC
jgi:hypothetical protein